MRCFASLIRAGAAVPQRRVGVIVVMDTNGIGGDGSRDRLDSWKEIAVYLKRDIRTVQRWGKYERLPVHRKLHDKLGSVYAFKAELDAW